MRHRGPLQPGRRVHARGALRPHFGAQVGGDAQGVSSHALASRRGLTVGPHGPAVQGPSRALGAPPASGFPLDARYASGPSGSERAGTR